MHSKLKLPPYGNILLAYQKQQTRLDFSIYIHTGNHAKHSAFTDIKAGLLASFLPEEQPFTAYDWPIFNQSIVICDGGNQKEIFLHKFCFHLLTHKPRVLYLWSDDHKCRFFKGATHE